MGRGWAGLGALAALAALAAAGGALVGPALGKGAGGVPLIEGSDLAGESGPVDLTDQNFDRLTAEGVWLVKVYAPWCAHCKVRARTPPAPALPHGSACRPLQVGLGVAHGARGMLMRVTAGERGRRSSRRCGRSLRRSYERRGCGWGRLTGQSPARRA